MEERIMSDFPVDDLSVWETNAAFWDACMGDDSNSFHREVVRPGVTELLSPQAGDVILEKTLSTLIQRPVSFESGLNWFQPCASFESGFTFAQ